MGTCRCGAPTVTRPLEKYEVEYEGRVYLVQGTAMDCVACLANKFRRDVGRAEDGGLITIRHAGFIRVCWEIYSDPDRSRDYLSNFTNLLANLSLLSIEKRGNWAILVSNMLDGPKNEGLHYFFKDRDDAILYAYHLFGNANYEVEILPIGKVGEILTKSEWKELANKILAKLAFFP